MNRRALLLGGAAAAGGAVGLLALGWWRRDGPGASAGDPLRPLPLSAMGFALTDQRGRRVVPQDWIGRSAMVFFGFTACPDVCPTTLSDISGWLDALGSDADRLTVALVTVDPARDTGSALAEYLSNFDPRILGLTGPQDQVDRALSDFRAFAERVPDGAGGYAMDHTAGVFLFDAAGRFVTTIDFHEDRAFALPKIRRALGPADERTAP